jgi:hypothetical protein
MGDAVVAGYSLLIVPRRYVHEDEFQRGRDDGRQQAPRHSIKMIVTTIDQLNYVVNPIEILFSARLFHFSTISYLDN